MIPPCDLQCRMTRRLRCPQAGVLATQARALAAKAGLLLALSAAAVEATPGVLNLTQAAEVSASSARPQFPASQAVDGLVSDASRWLAAENDAAPWLEIRFAAPVDIALVDVFSGWDAEPGIAGFSLSYESNGRWQNPPAGQVKSNQETARRVSLNAPKVTRLRLALAPKDAGRIREIAAYSTADIALGSGLRGDKLPISTDTHVIAVNQVGFERLLPKRFTAPLSPDGTTFSIKHLNGATQFQGEIRNHIGDFSKFQPIDPKGEFVIQLAGGNLKDKISDPFAIEKNFLQKRFWQPAVDFLIDSRAVVGTHPSAFGGCPWRDGTYYDAIIPSLVLLHLADPAAIAAMPRQIDWHADAKRVLAAGFKFDGKNPNSATALATTRKYYSEFEPPAADAPDVVKLIHWGAGYYLLNPTTHDPSDDPDGSKIHAQTVEQIAYVVWAWPTLEKWLPASFYAACRDFCFSHWKPSLEISKWWDPKTYLTPDQTPGKNPWGGKLHPYKGRHAPGHSIVPNLLMHEVALREKRDDAPLYLKAAVAQAQWIIANLDWNDPRSTKGHRMSEHRTIPNLVWLLQHYPDNAPPGIREKITQWAQIAVRRSNNLWDFRRYDDDQHWTIPKLNDLGNWISLPAIALAASWVVEDPALRARLEELAVAHVDITFGRNPRLAAAPSHPELGFTGIERGWPVIFPKDQCARLELTRGSLSSGPGTEMFPFNPSGAPRHAEGWVNYGASWAISLAYFHFHAINHSPTITPHSP